MDFWTTPVGWTLATIGGILLVTFAAGLGVPFLLLASGVGGASRGLPFLRRHAGRIRLASGGILVAFGMLLATGLIGQLSTTLSGVPGLEI